MIFSFSETEDMVGMIFINLSSIIKTMLPSRARGRHAYCPLSKDSHLLRLMLLDNQHMWLFFFLDCLMEIRACGIDAKTPDIVLLLLLCL